jgi:hypothetical protein
MELPNGKNSNRIIFSKSNHMVSLKSLNAGLRAQVNYRSLGFQILPLILLTIKSELDFEQKHHFDCYFRDERILVYRV